MTTIPPIGPQAIRPSSHTEPRLSLSKDILSILNTLGIRNITAIRVQPGLHVAPAISEIPRLVPTPDQQNILHALGIHTVLSATLSEDEEDYKNTWDRLNETILGEETMGVLQEAFGLTTRPRVLSDEAGNSILLLQKSLQELTSE